MRATAVLLRRTWTDVGLAVLMLLPVVVLFGLVALLTPSTGGLGKALEGPSILLFLVLSVGCVVQPVRSISSLTRPMLRAGATRGQVALGHWLVWFSVGLVLLALTTLQGWASDAFRPTEEQVPAALPVVGVLTDALGVLVFTVFLGLVAVSWAGWGAGSGISLAVALLLLDSVLSGFSGTLVRAVLPSLTTTVPHVVGEPRLTAGGELLWEALRLAALLVIHRVVMGRFRA